MGVAPEAIAKNFGYRLKRIDKFAPYTSADFAFFRIDFPSAFVASPRVEDKVNLCVFDRILCIL
jgi:hypothetical protein